MVDFSNWDDLPGDWGRSEIQEMYDDVTMLLNEDPDGLDAELEGLYRSVETHFDAHNELAQQEEWADAFYELEAAYDDRTSFETVLKGVNKDSIGESYEFIYDE